VSGFADGLIDEEKAQARYEKDAAKTQERRDREAEKVRMIEEKRQLADEKKLQYEADRQQRQEMERRDAAIKRQAALDRAAKSEEEAEEAAPEPTGFVTARTSEELVRSPEAEPASAEAVKLDHTADALDAPLATENIGPSEIAAGTLAGPSNGNVADMLGGRPTDPQMDSIVSLTTEEGPITQVGDHGPAMDNAAATKNVGNALPSELLANEGGSTKVVEVPLRSTEKVVVAQGSTPRDSLRRDSRVKGFFGKFRRSSQIQSKVNATTSTTKRDTAASGGAQTFESQNGARALGSGRPFTSEGTAVASNGTGVGLAQTRVDNNGGLYSEPSNEGVAPKGKERQRLSDVSAVSNEAELKRGRTGRSDDSSEEFEEARDKFDDDKLAAPGTGFASHSKEDESPARASSKFQEEL